MLRFTALTALAACVVLAAPAPQVTLISSDIGFLGPAPVTVTTMGQTITAVVPFPTIIPQALLPVAEGIFLGGGGLKEREAEPEPQVTLISSDIGFLGPATVTITTMGQTITAVVPFPTIIPQALLPVAEGIFLGGGGLKEREAEPEPQVTLISSDIGFLGPATVTVTTMGQIITAVVPFPTFVPQALLPVAENVFLGGSGI